MWFQNGSIKNNHRSAKYWNCASCTKHESELVIYTGTVISVSRALYFKTEDRAFDPWTCLMLELVMKTIPRPFYRFL
ncbi:hypothetical protein DPMN_035707 [Dreissena polymorpha]|uniref:Uncharacterized protein n=1 Tax=Dreissena polymorpha TaxID=45954 RepID=A0A9D4RKT6_DREPO|nr:hypothetical protein DPMN_035707 [Dreissena polymorpha]